MSEEKKQPSVLRFEQAVKAKDYSLACTELLEILGKIDTNFGGIDGIEFVYPEVLNNDTLEEERTILFCTQMADLIGELFGDPVLALSEGGVQRFFSYQRWIGLIFACSPYINADHILISYNRNPNKYDLSDVRLDENVDTIAKFCILYLPESNLTLNLDAIWNISPTICASLCIALQSPRFIGTEAAFSKRAAILQWFPEKLAQLPNLHDLPSNISHDVYMHCSYDLSANKHDVKKSLNQVIRRHLVEGGWQDRDVSKTGRINGKPVMVVLLEHFHSSHSIYRTHSTSLIAAREHFYLIGLGGPQVDEKGKTVFDEFRLLDNYSVVDKLYDLKNICEECGASVFYMPSIGMDLTTIFASNTRLAPIQVIALGHPATTHSEFIEYVIVEDDYVGEESCFSEKLLRLPKDALPYVPSASAPESVNYRLRENPDVVHIGIASTTMKLNPLFLATLKEIRDRASVKVHFHFALGQSNGITHPYVSRFIKRYLGKDATAYAHVPYDEYLGILHGCDMLLNPFPFGNTNGIIDMITLGLVGVCKTGPEVHEHIDEGLFKRLGLPDWLVTESVDDYINQAIRLAENHQERLALRREIIENNRLQTLFSGDARPMGQVLSTILNVWEEAKNALAESTPVAEKKAKPKAKKSETSVTKKAAVSSGDKKPRTKKASPLKEAAEKLKKAE